MKKLSVILDLIAFKHTIFSATFSGVAICAIYLSESPSFGALWTVYLLALCAIGLLTARNFAMGFNRLVDSKIDALNPRTQDRPSANGEISRLELVIFCAVNSALFVLTSYLINNLAFALSPLFLIILGGYSLLKRVSYSCHFVLGLSLGLAPISCAIAFLGYIPTWSIILSLGVALWVAGFDLLYSIQDLEFDRSHNLRSIPARYGLDATLLISRLCHGLAITFWIVFVIMIKPGYFALSALTLSGLMLLYQQIIVARKLSNIPRAFFVANGYLGVIFFAGMLLELIFQT